MTDRQVFPCSGDLLLHSSWSRRVHSARGLTLVEALTATAAAGVCACVATTVLAQRGGGLDAQYKLAQLAQAHACYAGDWDNRQWTALPYDAGLYGQSCSMYLEMVTCPNPAVVGRDTNGTVWAFYMAGGRCGGWGYPGVACGNWSVYLPIEFRADDLGYGACFIPNMNGMREYVSRNFYSPEWFSEDDPCFAGASTVFNAPYEFHYPIDAVCGGYADSSYCFSPAAMLHENVLRPVAEGGFQHPNVFPKCYAAPSVTQCVYPSLKTRMCEREWLRDEPDDGLYFTSGRAAAPITLFFDGSVQAVLMADAEADDAAVRESSASGDGLWSRDTTFGGDGYRPTGTVDGLETGFHILTTGGIGGRDLLERRGGSK